MKICSLAALAGLALAGSTQAATIFFSTTGTGVQVPGNLNLVLASGASQTVFMWAQLSTDLSNGAEEDPRPEKILGLALDLQSTNPGAATASAWATRTPGRWQVNEAPTYSNNLFSGLNLSAVTTVGLDGSSAANGGPGQLQVGSFTVTGGAAAVSATNFLKVGFKTIAYASNQGGPLINFGVGDQGVNPAAIGSSSTVSDLNITVTGGGEIPEPATLSLAAIAGLGLVRRRRA